MPLNVIFFEDIIDIELGIFNLYKTRVTRSFYSFSKLQNLKNYFVRIMPAKTVVSDLKPFKSMR